jgi:hypothetical protein
MLALALWTLAAIALQDAKTTSLPDTPQGRHVQAFIKAFNSGDEKTFLAAQEKIMTKGILQKRSAEERANLFRRMKGDFGTFAIERVAKATATQIEVIIPAKDGGIGTFTFDFEEKPPYLISQLGIDVTGGSPNLPDS